MNRTDVCEVCCVMPKDDGEDLCELCLRDRQEASREEAERRLDDDLASSCRVWLHEIMLEMNAQILADLKMISQRVVVKGVF